MGDDTGWQTVNRNKRTNKQTKSDVATAYWNGRSNHAEQTTYFFSDIPENFDAKAMLNIFQKYGNIVEVVIPAKRDKGGRRFGFARFDNVRDSRLFGVELDNVFIGRDKIRVNLPRFNRNHDKQRPLHREGGKLNKDFNDGKYTGNHNVSRQNNIKQGIEGDRSYANVTRHEDAGRQKEGSKKIFLSFNSNQEEVQRLKKMFIGEMVSPGMSYNTQEAFHSQGYFGVKVTPLGAHLVLLEGQEEGEVQSLMEDARGWMEQWFKEVRPWSTKEIDLERLVWLRVYGIPAHAWNDEFFQLISKPWGHYINADDGTNKKISMDVARLLIRTSGQRVVDEFLDVKIDGEVFHIRIIEDSYGPMRIMVQQSNRRDGRDDDSDSSEEEEGLFPVVEVEEEVEEVEREAVEENLLAIIPLNVNNDSVTNHEEEGSIFREDRLDEFNNFGIDSNLILTQLNSSKTYVDGGYEESFTDVDLLGQEGGVDGPAKPINSCHEEIGGVKSRKSESLISPIMTDSNKGGKKEVKGIVNKIGPVVKKNSLVTGPNSNPSKENKAIGKSSFVKPVHRKTETISSKIPIPSLPSSMRKQNQLKSSLKNRTPSKVAGRSTSSGKGKEKLPVSSNNSSSSSLEATDFAKRNPVGCFKPFKKTESSISSAGSILCCSSLKSADIMNCNQRFWVEHEQEVASRVWNGAAELGVEGDEAKENYVKRILINEKREEEVRRQREQHKQVNS